MVAAGDSAEGKREFVFNEDRVSVFQDERNFSDRWR